MSIRTFALVYGIVFLLVGIAGFIPGLVTPASPADPELAIESGHGYLFGLFPVNAVHNLVRIVFGVWGLAVYRNLSAAVTYGRAVAVIYAVLAIMGLIPALSTTFGLVPLHGNNVWLHVLLAAVAAYFGFVAPRAEPTPATTTRP